MKIEELIINNNQNTTLTVYLADIYRKDKLRPMVIVCPGGGFLGCSPNEGECVALHYMRKGFHASVLNYSTWASAPGKCMYPQPLYDLAEAVCQIRKHAKAWNVDEKKIAILGFSAGGHLCASYGNMWKTELLSCYGTEEQRKPNAVILGYALLDMIAYQEEKRLTISETRDIQDVLGGKSKLIKLQEFYRSSETALIGHSPITEKEAEKLSPIKYINPYTPPTFMWQTFTDDMLSPQQSLCYAKALHEAGIPCELHLFDKARHGISLADETSAKKISGIDSHVARWAELSVEWLLRVFEEEE